MNNLITSKEACEILLICRKTLWVYVNTHKHRKTLKSYRLSHKKLHFCKESVFAFLEKCESVS